MTAENNMDFGAEFDEDLFGESKATTPRSASVKREYQAKICEPMWFENDIEYQDIADQIQHHIYQGDSLYYKADFEEALHYYELARSQISPSNLALKRLLQESIARCHMNCSRHTEAQAMAEQLFEDSHYLEQKTSAYNLLVAVYHSAGKTQEEQNALQQLITIQPSNSVLWMKLAHTYQNASTGKCGCAHRDSKEKADTGQQIEAVEQRACGELCGSGQHQCAEGKSDSAAGRAGSAICPVISCEHHQDKSNIRQSDESDSVCHRRDANMKETQFDECLDTELLREWISTNELEKEIVHNRLCCVGCLLMTRLLLFHIQNTVVSFSETKHKQLSKEVSDRLKEIHLPDKLLQSILHLTKCVLYGSNSEEESLADGNHIPTDLAQRTQRQFEQKWFPWLPRSLCQSEPDL